MRVKSLILYCNKGVLHINGNLIKLDIYTVGILRNKLGYLISLTVIYGSRVARRCYINIGNIRSCINNSHEQSDSCAHSRNRYCYGSKSRYGKKADSAKLSDLGSRRVHSLLTLFDSSSSVVHKKTSNININQNFILSNYMVIRNSYAQPSAVSYF